MQLKLSLLPEYKDSRLYIDLVFAKNKKYLEKTDKHTLVFYNTEEPSEHINKNEVWRIEFRNFPEAYFFIKTNNIKNFNFRHGSYDKEIREINKGGTF